MSEFERLLQEAGSQPIEGWDFSWLYGRMSTTPPPWNFAEIVARHARESPDLLDVGTGGGEWLAALAYRPPRTVATEGWPPNVDVAGARLRPLGITVVRTDGARDNVAQQPDEQSGSLPFPGASFALISNRHESFVAAEVARVLAPGGSFITQQTGGNYDQFYDALGLTRPSRGREWNLALATAQVNASGIEVLDSAEGHEETSYSDIGAIAWYLRAVPWAVAEFSLQSLRPSLLRLHERIKVDGPIVIRQPSFWLKGVKPL